MTSQLISKCTEDLASIEASLRTKNRVDGFAKCRISPRFPASELDVHGQASEEHNLFGERVGLAPRTPRNFHVDTWRALHTHTKSSTIYNCPEDIVSVQPWMGKQVPALGVRMLRVLLQHLEVQESHACPDTRQICVSLQANGPPLWPQQCCKMLCCDIHRNLWYPISMKCIFPC
jgi:hypothetical protein